MRAARDPIAAFWSRVDKSAGPDACWLWTGPRNHSGYGLLQWDGKTSTAHRVAKRLSRVQRIPEKRFVCHKCDNPPCCNPAHLYIGDARSNARDASRRGRLEAPRRWYAAARSVQLRGVSVYRGHWELRRWVSRQAGLTVPKLARLIGVSRGAVESLLRARHTPIAPTLIARIASVTGVQAASWNHSTCVDRKALLPLPSRLASVVPAPPKSAA